MIAIMIFPMVPSGYPMEGPASQISHERNPVGS
jgi:hypothetical protein